MTAQHWLSLLFTVGFMIVHFSQRFLQLSTNNPRSPVLSMTGGATVAYVFLYLLPELNKYLQPIKETVSGSWLAFFEDYTYLLALFGLLIYYGLDILAKSNKAAGERGDDSSSGLFLLHISSFFIYNLIIGYLLVREEFHSNWAMTVYFIALAAHFVATDHTLKDLHRDKYDKYGRWFLVGAIFIGWLVGIIFQLHEVIVGIAVAFLAGGIILNVFKDELPEGKSSNYSAFALGALTITFLLMLIGR